MDAPPPSTELQRLLDRVAESALVGDHDLALRFVDAAHRRSPHSPDILRLLGRILASVGETKKAIERLDQAAESTEDPEIEAEIVEVLLTAGQIDQASLRLRRALALYGVGHDDELARAARRLILAPESPVRAWFGLDPTLRIWGEVVDPHARSEIQLLAGDAPPIPLGSRLDEVDPRIRVFSAQPLGQTATTALRISFNGEPLAGEPLSYPPDFRIDARSRYENGAARGWARLGWAPRTPPRIYVGDGRGPSIAADVQANSAAPFRHRFSLDIEGRNRRGKHLSVEILTPDGVRAPLADSPILLEPPRAPAKRRRPIWSWPSLRPRRPRDAKIDIIIPVYRGLAETSTCILSVLDTLGRDAEIIVINDASPEPALVEKLSSWAASGLITLLRNEANQGFAASVNRGLSVHPHRDIVILNADTEVFPGWLTGLKAAAARDPRICTVTPLTNSGSIASYPGGDGSPCSPDDAARLAVLAAEINSGEVIDIPTGVGFCMFVRREGLDRTGPFDVAAFGRGYGEENDFCRRASALGWRHVLATDVFVRHIGGLSFGRDRLALMERNRRILNDRHPDYDHLVAAFVADDPIKLARRRLDEARLRAEIRPFILLITLDAPGGVERMVRRRAAQLSEEGFQPLILKPARDGASVAFEAANMAGLADLCYEIDDEFDLFSAFISSISILNVEFHHFLNFKQEVIEVILNLGVPFDVYIHDYSWICPRLTLLSGENRFCGEPALRSCERCARKHGGSIKDVTSVRALRQRSADWLRGARRVIAPCEDVSRRFRRYFPGRPIETLAWEPPPADAEPGRPAARSVVRVAVVGAIGTQKGYQVLLACAQDAAARALDIEFVVIGFTEDDGVLLETGKTFITGRYDDDELLDLIRREAPDLAFFPSVTPETWCFTLSHALAAGLPVVAFDIGAIAERLRGQVGDYSLLPLDAPIAAINDRLISDARRLRSKTRDSSPASAQPHVNHEFADEPGSALLALSEKSDPIDIATMTEGPGDLMQDTKDGLSVSVEVLTLNKGIYVFTVKSAAPKRVGDEGELVLPAVQVGLGPGVGPAQMEVMSGLRTEGAWLYEPRDMLIIKVKANPTLLLLTSLRGPGMAPLEIAVERIDNRKAAAEPAATPLPALQAPAPVPASRPRGRFWMVDEANGQSKPGPDPQRGAALRTQITLHLRNRGDTHYVDDVWAGELGDNLPIEAFSIAPLDGLAADQIEYKGITVTGAETPWVSGGAPCGTHGLDMPLVGFAIRLRQDIQSRYDCVYRGAFGSGKIIGPLGAGTACRSEETNDFLKGIQLTITPREREEPALMGQAGLGESGPSPRDPAPRRAIGPRFSVFRDDVQ